MAWVSSSIVQGHKYVVVSSVLGSRLAFNNVVISLIEFLSKFQNKATNLSITSLCKQEVINIIMIHIAFLIQENHHYEMHSNSKLFAKFPSQYFRTGTIVM